MKMECLGQGGAKRGVVGTKLLPQCPLGPHLLKQASRHPGRRSPCSHSSATVSGAGAAAQDVDAPALGAGCCDITWTSNRTTSTPGAGPRDDPTTRSIGPLWEQNQHQQGSRPSRDPWHRDSPRGPARALVGDRG
jgi:hypothetical protein